MYQYFAPSYNGNIFHYRDRCITFYLFIQQLLNISSIGQLQIMQTWTFVNSFSCVPMFPFLLGTWLGAELLSHTVILCWTTWGTSRLFSEVTASFHIPPSSIWSHNIFTSLLKHPCFFPSLWVILSCFFAYSFLLEAEEFRRYTAASLHAAPPPLGLTIIICLFSDLRIDFSQVCPFFPAACLHVKLLVSLLRQCSRVLMSARIKWLWQDTLPDSSWPHPAVKPH
jgi:hypothetical protein